jgi:hypothetical protein
MPHLEVYKNNKDSTTTKNSPLVKSSVLIAAQSRQRGYHHYSSYHTRGFLAGEPWQWIRFEFAKASSWSSLSNRRHEIPSRSKDESPDVTRGSQHAPVNSEPKWKLLSHFFSSQKGIRTCLLIFFAIRIMCTLVVGCRFGSKYGKTQRLVLEATQVQNKN